MKYPYKLALKKHRKYIDNPEEEGEAPKIDCCWCGVTIPYGCIVLTDVYPFSAFDCACSDTCYDKHREFMQSKAVEYAEKMIRRGKMRRALCLDGEFEKEYQSNL